MPSLRDPWDETRALQGRTVLLAMSGGVDSSAAAVLLQRRGARVLGLTMKNFCYSSVESTEDSSCCSLAQMLDARRVCDSLGMAHYLYDATGDFGTQVMTRFVDEYGAGRTPNPCVDCNRAVRFPLLLQRARELGADWIATGHYARIGVDATGRPFVRRSLDAAKDQSYFLHGVPAACLERTLFPLGSMRKEAARQVAREAGLAVAEKGESQEICFLPDGDRSEFLRQRGSASRGDIVNLQGEKLGEHEGIGNFTVGQRRGLQIAVGHPLYVHHIEAGTHRVVVGAEDSLWTQGVQVDRFWYRGEPDGVPLQVQLRSRSAPAPLRSLEMRAGVAHLTFETPQRAVAPGQAAVLYDDDTVVGGGRILDAIP